MNRLTKRRKPLIGGCVFAAVIIGVACTGITPAQAVTVEFSFKGSSNPSMVGSSDLAWTVSNGDLGSVPPLGIGEGVMSGGYQDGYILPGPSLYKSWLGVEQLQYRSLRYGEPGFPAGSWLYKESMMLHSARAAASCVMCGADSLDAEGANITAVQYCETVVVHSLFMADDLAYRPAGSIDLADLELPDSFGFTPIWSGSGMGSMNFGRGVWLGLGRLPNSGMRTRSVRTWGSTAGSTSGRT